MYVLRVILDLGVEPSPKPLELSTLPVLGSVDLELHRPHGDSVGSELMYAHFLPHSETIRSTTGCQHIIRRGSFRMSCGQLSYHRQYSWKSRLQNASNQCLSTRLSFSTNFCQLNQAIQVRSALSGWTRSNSVANALMAAPSLSFLRIPTLFSQPNHAMVESPATE